MASNTTVHAATVPPERAKRVEGRAAVVLRLVAPVVVATASACGSSSIPAPRILDVAFATDDGQIGYIGVDTVLVVTGENFADDIVPDAGNPDESKVSSVSITVQDRSTGGAVSLVDPVYLSPTRFEATLPLDISPGAYDVRLARGEVTQSIEEAFTMGYQATTLFVLTTSEEPAPGDENNVTIEIQLRAADGQAGIWKEDFEILSTTSGQDVTSTLSPTLSVAAGETLTTGPMAIYDSSAEMVTITLDGIPDGIVQSPSGQLAVEFIPGTPARARVLTATEVAGNLVDTFLQVEDEWGNACIAHETYTAGFFSLPGCTGGGGAVSEPITVTSNSGMAPVTFTCPTPDTPTVLFTEFTATNYSNAGGYIIFIN